jgi:uncharacterized protein YbaR (Trm112 family)
MHRAFAIDVLACPHCGGRLRLIATLHDPIVIRNLLAHLGWPAPGRSPAPRRPRPDRLYESATITVPAGHHPLLIWPAELIG